MKKISKIIILALAMMVGLLAPTAVLAEGPDDPFCDESLKGSPVWETMGCGKTAEENKEAFSGTVIGIINNVLGVIGLVAVVFVVYSGFLYLTSAGDASKTKKAKETLFYALIGLVIVGLAYAIVNFVIIHIINKA